MKQKKESSIVLRLSMREARDLSEALHRAGDALEGRAEDIHKVASRISDDCDKLADREWRSRRAEFRRLRLRRSRRVRSARG